MELHKIDDEIYDYEDGGSNNNELMENEKNELTTTRCEMDEVAAKVMQIKSEAKKSVAN